MNADVLTALTVFALALLVGVEVISKVPTTLHTPLMSATNAVHGIVVVGAILTTAEADSLIEYALAFGAIAFGAANVTGGYAVTDRMLHMFRTPRTEQEPKP